MSNLPYVHDVMVVMPGSWQILPSTLAIIIQAYMDEYTSLDQSSCEWIRADARHLNLTIQHLPDFGLQLCKSIPDIPWHHTSIRIQRIPESSRINAVSAKNIASGVCVCILWVTGKVYTYAYKTLYSVKKKERKKSWKKLLCCRIWDLDKCICFIMGHVVTKSQQ